VDAKAKGVMEHGVMPRTCVYNVCE